MKQSLNITLDIEADSEECARTIVYQSLVSPNVSNVSFPNAPVKVIREHVRKYPQGYSRKTHTTEFWKNQDWANKTIEEISIETGFSASLVRNHRLILFGPQSPFVKRKKRQPENESTKRKVTVERLSAVDWSRQDADLGRELGVTRERMRQYRKRLGHPPAIHPSKHKLLVEQLKADWDIVYHMRYCDIAEKYGRSKETIAYAVKRAGLSKPQFVRSYPWHLFNMSLPNTVLSEIWGVAMQNVASRRFNYQLPFPTWRKTTNPKPPEFLAAIEAEKLKAAQWKESLTPTPNP